MFASALNDESGRSALARRSRRLPAGSRRLAWVSVILGIMSIDLEALALLSSVLPAPTRWYADLLLLYGATTVVPLVMLMLGVPFALLGLLCAGVALSRGRAPLTTLLGIAICAACLAIPACYVLFVGGYLRALM